MHLAHKKQGLKGVYDKAVFSVQRQRMVQWYGDYLEALESAAVTNPCTKYESKVILKQPHETAKHLIALKRPNIPKDSQLRIKIYNQITFDLTLIKSPH